MAAKKKGVIGILTGGGDVPGLNPAIRAVTIRALREGWQLVCIRRGWGGLMDIVRDKDADNSKIKRFVPGFNCEVKWSEGLRRALAWYEAHPEFQTIDPEADAKWDRILENYSSAWSRKSPDLR